MSNELIILILLFLRLFYIGLDDMHTRWLRRMMFDYSERFPGRCFICGVARAVHTTPDPHDCIEREGAVIKEIIGENK